MRLISRKKSKMASVWESLHCVLLQVVNAGVKEAFEEFVNTWVEERLQDILGDQPCPGCPGCLVGLRPLIMNIMDLVSHFAEVEVEVDLE